jgi:hypothetical protein
LHQWARRAQQEVRERGAIACQIPNVLALHENLWCDIVRHETINYWTLRQLHEFLSEHRLALRDVRESVTEPGVWQVTISDQGEPSERARQAMDREATADLEASRSWEDFAWLVEQCRNLLNSEIEDWQYRCKAVAAFTNSGYGMTTLSLCDACLRLPCLIDENPKFHGHLTPGHRIPVVGPERLRIDHVDVLLVLRPDWLSLGKGPLHDYWQAGGRILIPAPKPRYLERKIVVDRPKIPIETAVFADFG